jgi:hypothetical protein
VILKICLILVLLISFLSSPAQSTHSQPNLTRVHTETITFRPESEDPARLVNAEVAFRQMQEFFDGVQFRQGVEYSFNRDVLRDSMARSQGYVPAVAGFGDGANSAASLLNVMVHQARFWDSDGIEKPVFEQTSGRLAKNDKSLGMYAVAIFVNSGGGLSLDYTWRLNPAYDGPPPRLTSRFDTAGAKVSLSMTYANKVAPPVGAQLSPARIESLSKTLRAIIGNRRLGVYVIPVDNPKNQFGVNEHLQVPSASSWKGPGIIYFFEHIGPEIWNKVPVEYWRLKNPLRVVPEYRKEWIIYNEILRYAYVMTVFSGNHEAANVLAYVFTNMKRENGTSSRGSNALIAFNDWGRKAVGMSSESGLFSWQFGDLARAGYIDARLADRRILDGEDALFYTTTYSARDLALFYYHLATVGKEKGYYDKAIELLSIRAEILSMIEGQTAYFPQIRTATKDGYFGPESAGSLRHDVNNDAGILFFPDGRQYVVAFTAFDAVDLESDVIGYVIRALLEDREPEAQPTPTLTPTNRPDIFGAS